MSAGVPFLDLGRLHASVADELKASFDRVLADSAFVGAGVSLAFEDAFAAKQRISYAAGCGSGTDALTLALAACGIVAGDEVAVPAMTFVATAEAVVHAGGTPVLVDVDPSTLLITSESVAEVPGGRLRAVVPVHLYGHPAPLTAVDEWRQRGLVVVEDAAQAHLATWRGRPVGSAGQAAAFSFYPGKNLGAMGDGGAVVSDDAEIHARVLSLRDHGAVDKYRHEEIGWCSRLDGVQAAWLEVKLRHLPGWTAARRRIAERYRERLPGGLLVPWEDGAVHHLVVVRIEGGRRDDVAKALGARGIGTGVHYPLALSQQPALASWARPCPNAEKAAAQVLSLPIDPLMTEADVDQVCEALVMALD
ncbi:MAG: DegT/DnrJ/EryC1/StrS family aminotransferase [Acidimicrobiia bacterium]|nr:DegT/DnrJ/EryC1/StrS family aminotransferase [Acidimicrobiia bacterium]